MYKQVAHLQYFYTDEKRVIEILDNYCAHRSIFWNAFFGLININKNNIHTYYVPNWKHFEKLRLDIES